MSYHNSVTTNPEKPFCLSILAWSYTQKQGNMDKWTRCSVLVCLSAMTVFSHYQIFLKTVCERYRKDNVLCPPNLGCGLFTVATSDNMDHKLSPSTAEGSFHGTGISLYHYLSSENEGQVREFENEMDISSKHLKALHDFCDSKVEIL